jgi:hypothetical protein
MMRIMRKKISRVFNNLRIISKLQNGFNVRVLPEEPIFLLSLRSKTAQDFSSCIDPRAPASIGSERRSASPCLSFKNRL